MTFPPPSGFTQLIEVYRGVEIWYDPIMPRYWCQPTSGYMSFEYTVQGCRDYIDWVLGPPLIKQLVSILAPLAVGAALIKIFHV